MNKKIFIKMKGGNVKDETNKKETIEEENS